MKLLDKIINNFKPWLVDTAERAGKTFGQVFILQLIASGWFTMEGVVDWSIPQKAAMAAGGAALSILSSAFSKLTGNSGTASLVHADVVHDNGENV